MNNLHYGEYKWKIVRTSDNKLGRVIEESEAYNDEIIIVLQDQNSRNLINKHKNTGTKIKTKKELITVLDQTQEINKILDERLVKTTKQPIIIQETNNVAYQWLKLKPNMNKIMQIIFQFVAKKNYNEFYSLPNVRKDMKNEFIQQFEKELWVQINSENCYQFIRLLKSISGGWVSRWNLSFFDKNIYIYPKDNKKDNEWENEHYTQKNNLNNFVEELCIYININYNKKRKKREFKHNLNNPALYNQKPKVLKNTWRDYWLLHEQ